MLDDLFESWHKRIELADRRKAFFSNIKKLNKEGKSFFLCNQVLNLWEGIDPKQLFKLLLKEELAAFICAVNKDYPQTHIDELLGKDVGENFSFFNQYIPASIETMQKYAHFKKSDIEAYEKKHPEILVKPENKEVLDLNNPDLPEQLKIAVKCWLEFVSKGMSDEKGFKDQILDWLKKEYPKQSDEAIKRIAIILNPNPKGGAPKTPTKK